VSERLRQEFAVDVYLGTGGFEGGADQKGKVKPRAIGVVRHITPVLIDAANQWWDCAPIDGFQTFIGAWQGAFGYVTDVANPPAAGKVYVDMANGRIRTNGMPTLPITVSFVSKFAAGATTAADTSKQVMKSLGMVDADLDLPTFTALNTATDAPVGTYITAPIAGDALVGILLGAVGAFHTEAGGKVQVLRFEPPTAATSSDAAVALLITDEDIARGSFKRRPEVIPPYRIDLEYARCFTPMDHSQIAAAALAADRTFVLSEYRNEPYTAAAVKTRHKSSRPEKVSTAQDDQAEALLEVTRLGGMFAKDQEFADLTLTAAAFKLPLHAEVWVQSSFNNVDCAWRAYEVRQMSRSGRVELGLWRPVP
jgi:hypothetical protein